MEQSTQPSSPVLCGMRMLCSPRRIDYREDDEVDCSLADENGNLPLHDAIASFAMDCLNAPSDQSLLELRIESLIKCNPEAVCAFNYKGLTPLHMACREGGSLAVIHALVKAQPESVKTTTQSRQKMLPLHLVCRYYSGKASEKYRILTYLLRAFPKAVEIATASGDLALHLACRNYFCTLAIIDLIAQAYPEGVRTVNNKHQLPLHIACGHQYMKRLSRKHNHRKQKECDMEDQDNSCSSRDIIGYLAEAYPEGTNVFDTKGTLPLHAAVKGYQTPETIQYLVDTCPDAVEYTDNVGRTALHCAVSRQVPCLRTVELLLAENPAAAEAYDDLNKLPVDYARKAPAVVSALAGALSSDSELC